MKLFFIQNRTPTQHKISAALDALIEDLKDAYFKLDKRGEDFCNQANHIKYEISLFKALNLLVDTLNQDGEGLMLLDKLVQKFESLETPKDFALLSERIQFEASVLRRKKRSCEDGFIAASVFGLALGSIGAMFTLIGGLAGALPILFVGASFLVTALLLACLAQAFHGEEKLVKSLDRFMGEIGYRCNRDTGEYYSESNRFSHYLWQVSAPAEEAVNGLSASPL